MELDYNLRPWIDSIREPKGYIKPPHNQRSQPRVSLKLSHVYGYRSKDCRNNLKYLKNCCVVYHAACLCIVLDQISNRQSIFDGHCAEITALGV